MHHALGVEERAIQRDAVPHHIDETIAIAMMMNDKAITTITQNMGSLVLN